MGENTLPVSQLQQLAENTNNALTLNKQSIDNAQKAGQALIEKIKQAGMNEALDQECNSFLVKCKRTLELMNERRKPATQLFDQVKKYFTDLENQIDPTKGELYLNIQGYRDGYALQKVEETRKKEEETKKKLEAEKEKADITAKIETALYSWFNSYLNDSLSLLQKFFNNITLQDYFGQAQDIAGFSENYPKPHFDKFNHNVILIYLTKDDLKVIVVNILAGKYDQFCNEYRERIHEKKQELLEMLPSKKEELEAIARAEKKNAEKAAQLKAEKEKREKEEAEKLEREAAERAKKAEEEAEKRKQESSMEATFAATEKVALGKRSGAQVRKSWLIKVTHPAAWVLIFQLWFEHEGGKMHIDKIEKVTLGRMKKFCESLAGKNIRIESKYIEYKEDFKAIAKS